jgi:5-formyltetrahydrofolate cyclo-ligase
VLVPLLIFDRQGHRVGYGKGFYDRFLRRCGPETRRIGISLFDGIDKISDVHSSDETLHQCITPEAIITFK